MGLLDSFTNWAQSGNGQSQPVADGLLAAGLGILANNRGLTSGTQAIGMGGLQGLQQYQQSKQYGMQQQMQNAQLQQLGFGLQKNKMLLDMARGYLGGDQPPAAAPSAPGAADMGGMPDGSQGSGPGVQSSPVPTGAPAPAGMPPSAPPQGGMPPPAPPQGGMPIPNAAPIPPQAAPQGAAPSAGGIFGNMPKGLVAYGLMTDPGKLFENAASQYSPTDFMKTLRAAGIEPNSDLGKQMLQHQVAVLNADKVSAFRGGGYVRNDTTGQMQQLPNVPEGFTAAQGPNGWQIVPVQGGTDAMAASSGASARGKAGYQLTDVWDPTANGGKGGTIHQTVANAAGAATPASQAIVQTESGGNPNAVSPKGAQGAWQVMPNTQANPGYGVTPAQNNSPAELDRVGKDYYNSMTQRYGSPTLGAIAYNMGPGATDSWLKSGAQFEKLPQETRNYVGKVSTLTALNSMPQGAQSQAPQPQGGAFAAAPPLGVTTNTDASQKGGAEAMNTSFAKLQAARSTGQQALEGLSKMQQIAANKSFISAGPLGTDLTAINPAAAEYQKQRANVVSMLANQSPGKDGVTDAGRALAGDSVPDYGKPQSAIKDGLTTLANQTHLNMLKATVLTPAFNSGDSNTYNALENQFDQTIKPSMMPTLNTVISMPAGQARATALQAAAKDPQMRSALEILIKGGALK